MKFCLVGTVLVLSRVMPQDKGSISLVLLLSLPKLQHFSQAS